MGSWLLGKVPSASYPKGGAPAREEKQRAGYLTRAEEHCGTRVT